MAGSLHWCTSFLIKTSCTNCRVFERVIKLPLWSLQANLALPAGSRMSVYVQTNTCTRWMQVKNASSGMLTHLQAPVKLVRTSDLWFRSINAAWKQSLRIFSHGFMRCTEIPVGSNAPFSSAYWNSLRCIMHPSNSPSVETDAGSRPIMLLPPLYLKPHIWLQPPVICAPGVSHFGAPDCFGKMIPGDFQQHSPGELNPAPCDHMTPDRG